MRLWISANFSCGTGCSHHGHMSLTPSGSLRMLRMDVTCSLLLGPNDSYYPTRALNCQVELSLARTLASNWAVRGFSSGARCAEGEQRPCGAHQGHSPPAIDRGPPRGIETESPDLTTDPVSADTACVSDLLGAAARGLSATPREAPPADMLAEEGEQG